VLLPEVGELWADLPQVDVGELEGLLAQVECQERPLSQGLHLQASRSINDDFKSRLFLNACIYALTLELSTLLPISLTLEEKICGIKDIIS